MELPNGVFITMMPRWVAFSISTLSTPIPARTDDLEIVGSGDDFFGCLGGRPNGQTVILTDDLDQLVFVLAQIRQVINLNALVLEDLNGSGRQFIGK